jgi:hypothetical protein
MSGRGYNTFHGFDEGPPPPSFPPAQSFGIPQYPAFFGIPAPALPQYGFNMGGQTHPAPRPLTDHGFPGIHLRNHTGGVGLPPGYDYAFPAEHCKIHVFTTKTPPWQSTTMLHSWNNSTHVKLFVPVSTTLKELMQGLGCNNGDPKKNVLHEVQEGGNGKWLKGITINASCD